MSHIVFTKVYPKNDNPFSREFQKRKFEIFGFGLGQALRSLHPRVIMKALFKYLNL